MVQYIQRQFYTYVLKPLDLLVLSALYVNDHVEDRLPPICNLNIILLQNNDNRWVQFTYLTYDYFC